MQDLTISLIQTSLIWEDPEANISNFDKLLSGSMASTDLIILPEMFNTGFTMDAASNAEMMEAKTMQWMAVMAADKQCVICGSIIIKEEDNYYNRLIWMCPDSNYHYYDKKHLFRMGDEHLFYTSGKKKLIVDLKGWKIMPLICYDLRFPVWSKNEFIDEQYTFDLLIYVANWPAVRSDAWRSLIKGRAIENMAYAAGVNRIGVDGRGYEYSGDSLIAGPNAEQLTEVNTGLDTMITSTLKASELIAIREKLGVGNDWDGFELV
jgi:omega-amidase